MSTPSGPLKLSDPLGEEKFYNARADISGDYTKAEVVSSEPNSICIVCIVKDWDHQHPGDFDVEERQCLFVRQEMYTLLCIKLIPTP